MAFISRNPKEPHDREVLTRYVGELIQHDSSLHLWAPAAHQKWYLITSLDDHSRFMFYAILVRKETSWTHILAFQTVILRHGLPIAYYVDSHSIFRFVQGRDSLWHQHHLLTDEATPSGNRSIQDCNVKVTHALSPQAKGKIERPYGWLQDRLIRTCVREEIADIQPAQKVLNKKSIVITTARSTRPLRRSLTSVFKELKAETVSLPGVHRPASLPIHQRYSLSPNGSNRRLL